MGNLFGRVGNKITKLNQMYVQTSVYGTGIPVFWGQARLTANLIDYGNFTAGSVSAGKGGFLGSGKGGQYDYKATTLMALCEGPISAILTVYYNTETTYSLSQLGLTPFLGTYPQSAYTGHQSSPAQNYPGIAFVAGNVDLGSSATLPNYGYECLSTINGALPGQPDASPKAVLNDIFTNQYYGIGYPSAWIGDLTTMETYCLANGMAVSPVVRGQNPARDFLNTFIEGLNCAARMSGGKLDILPYGQTNVTGNGFTYTAPSAPEYDIFDSDFISTSGEENPIKISRTRPQDTKNAIQLTYADRTNNYNSVTLSFFNDAGIQQYGLLAAPPVSYDFFCVQSAAQAAGGLALWRQQFRNTYKFRIGRRFQRLDCLDIISLTHAAQGLNNQWVQITDIQENDDGTLDITANEYLQGTSNPPIYGPSSNTSYTPSYNASAGNINTPIVFTAPQQIATNGGYEAWIIASGSATNYGGFDVYVSSDGTDYRLLGSYQGECPEGVLTANLAVGSDPDNTHTLSVDLSESNGTLNSGTQADADNHRLLAYVGGEIISYETATLTGPNAYNITYLRRGLYGTSNSGHLAGSQFAYLNSTKAFKFAFSKDQIGETLYIKLPTFNVYGGGQESLGSCTAYTYVVGSPPSPVLIATLTLSSTPITASDGSVQPGITAQWTPPSDPTVTEVEIQYMPVGGSGQPQSAKSNDVASGFLAIQAGILSSTPMQFRARYISEGGLVGPWTAWENITPSAAQLATTTQVAINTNVSSLKQVWTQQAQLAQSIIQALSAHQTAIQNTNTAWQTAFTTISSQSGFASAESLSTLEATVEGILGSTDAGLAATVASLQTTVADLQSGKADASDVTDLNAQINTPTTGLAAQITSLQTAVASLDPTGVESIVQTALTSITGLQSQLGKMGQSVIQALTALVNAQIQVQATASYATSTLQTLVQDQVSAMAESQAELGAYLNNSFNALSASFTTLQATVVTNNSALTTSITNLNADFTNLSGALSGYSPTSTVAAAINNEASVRASADNANATNITTLQAALSGYTGSGAVANAISGLVTTVNTAVSVFAQSTTPVANHTGDLWFDTGLSNNPLYYWNSSSWVQVPNLGNQTNFVQSTAPTANHIGDMWVDTAASNQLLQWDGSRWVKASDVSTSASASSILSLTSTLTGFSPSSTVSASITTINNTIVGYSPSSTIASAITTLSTTVSGNTTSITNLQSVTNGISAYWGIAINTNNAITGLISLTGNGTTSAFTVLATDFAVYTPGGAIAPFEVTGSAVYVNVPLVTGLVTANMIAANTIVAGNISSGAVNGTILANDSVSGNHINNGVVATQHLANNAATNPGSTTFGSSTWSASNSWQTLASFTGTFSGGTIQLDAYIFYTNNSGASQGIYFQILRDSTVIATFPRLSTDPSYPGPFAAYAVVFNNNQSASTTLCYDDTSGPTGSHTYYLQFQWTDATPPTSGTVYQTGQFRVTEILK